MISLAPLSVTVTSTCFMSSAFSICLIDNSLSKPSVPVHLVPAIYLPLASLPSCKHLNVNYTTESLSISPPVLIAVALPSSSIYFLL